MVARLSFWNGPFLGVSFRGVHNCIYHVMNFKAANLLLFLIDSKWFQVLSEGFQNGAVSFKDTRNKILWIIDLPQLNCKFCQYLLLTHPFFNTKMPASGFPIFPHLLASLPPNSERYRVFPPQRVPEQNISRNSVLVKACLSEVEVM